MAALHSSATGCHGTGRDPAAAAAAAAAARCWLDVGVLRSAARREGGREIWEGTRGRGGRGWLGVCESAAWNLTYSHTYTHKHDLSVCLYVCVLQVVQRMPKEDPYPGPPLLTRSLDVT